MEEVIKNEEQIIDWVTFYRRNIPIFVEDYLEIPLHLFQENILEEIQESDVTVLVCSRGSSKSFCTAIIALSYALLYSNCNILVTSLTLNQSNLILEKKIDEELSNPKTGISPILRQLRLDGYMEIRKDQNTGGKIIKFGNGSEIFAVALGESMRGNRSQIVILDEAAICQKKLYQEIAEPTLTQRMFKGKPIDYKEEPKQILLSSAKTKTNWLWTFLKNCVNWHYKKTRTKYGFMCVDTFTSTCAGIQTKNQYLQRKKNTDDLSFQQEYLNIFIGTNENSIFKLEDFEQNQILYKPFYPTTIEDLLDEKEKDYKFSDEWIRILVCDIALATGDENDNSVYIFMAINKNNGQRKVENIIVKNGLNTMLQVILMKRYFYDYKATYFMQDVKGVGQGVFDLLTTETFDSEYNKIYPAWTVCTDKALQITSDTVMNDKIQRTISSEAEDIIIPFAGTAELNSQMHLLLRKALKDKMISLMKDESEYQARIEEKDSSFILKSSEEKAFIMNPFFQTRIMINEAISLEVSFTETGNIKLKEAKRTDTKDRYMTLAMANLLADRIYNKYKKEDDGDLTLEDFYDIYDN